MKIYGIIGWKNAGKTTLTERLIAQITARGLRVSTIKHSHHEIDLDPPGTDSHRHRAAGAHQTILATPHRLILTQDHPGREPPLGDLIAQLAVVDLILIEGFKHAPHPKIEVHRPAAGHPLIQPSDPNIRAVASDAPLPKLGVPQINLNNPKEIADFILKDLGLAV